jgi:hypothetical protein
VKESISDIRFLRRNEINVEEWDRCILNAPNGLIYARSFYLDFMAENWCALIKGSYQFVMPLTWNKKFGFSYLYQPFFTKSLGVFGNSPIPFEISSFLDVIPKEYKYWDIDLNEFNFILNDHKRSGFIYYARTNYLLSLKKDYPQLQLQYKRLANRMKKKAMESKIQIIKGENPSHIVELYKKYYNHRHRFIREDVYDKIKRCASFAFNNNLAETYLARSLSGEILAYYIILRDEKFVYSLLGGSTAEGKNRGAFYLLTDTIIKEHAGSNKTFRFEGSDVSGISFFDSLFGPEKINFPHLIVNKLPFPFRYFK